MPRPCLKWHPTPIHQRGEEWKATSNSCRFCWFYVNNEAYRKAWDGEESPEQGGDTKMPCFFCKKESHPELEGIPYDLSIPRPCWLYANDPRYKALGDGTQIPLRGDQPKNQPIDKECVQRQQNGPGTKLKEIINGLGLGEWQGCKCESRSVQMNTWGIGGCKKHRDEIVNWLKEAFHHLSLLDKLKTLKLAFQVSPLDPFGSIVDESIKQAENG